MEETMSMILKKVLWDANGWVLVGLSFVALAGFLTAYIASAAGKGDIARMIGATTTFVGISLVLTVVATVFKRILSFLLGWG